jgi:hypothetical protein
MVFEPSPSCGCGSFFPGGAPAERASIFGFGALEVGVLDIIIDRSSDVVIEGRKADTVVGRMTGERDRFEPR